MDTVKKHEVFNTEEIYIVNNLGARQKTESI